MSFKKSVESLAESAYAMGDLPFEEQRETARSAFVLLATNAPHGPLGPAFLALAERIEKTQSKEELVRLLEKHTRFSAEATTRTATEPLE